MSCLNIPTPCRVEHGIRRSHRMDVPNMMPRVFVFGGLLTNHCLFFPPSGHPLEISNIKRMGQSGGPQCTAEGAAPLGRSWEMRALAGRLLRRQTRSPRRPLLFPVDYPTILQGSFQPFDRETKDRIPIPAHIVLVAPANRDPISLDCLIDREAHQNKLLEPTEYGSLCSSPGDGEMDHTMERSVPIFN